MCDCTKTMNKLLAEHNTTLTEHSMINITTGKMRQSIAICTEKLNRKDRQKAKVVLPSFCPFCGEKIKKDADPAAADTAAGLAAEAYGGDTAQPDSD